MSAPTPDALRAALRALHDPHLDAPLAEEVVRSIAIDEGRVMAVLRLPYAAASWHAELAARAEAALRAVPGVVSAQVEVEQRVLAHRVQEGLAPLPGVKNLIAVASGKGGVGKSTTAVNLALGLAAEGARVGVLDADIHGPSIPMMLGLAGKPESPDGQAILPKQAHGLQAMSIGLFLGEDQPAIWRGPMATQYLQQLLSTTRWDELDYLVVDLPPGTGDIQLTLSQRVPVSGAVIVTTPQDIALLDAKKALKMFEKVAVPVLGIVENMALHRCPNCGHVEHVFGQGGGQAMAERYGVPLLGSLPLDIRIREQADGGAPTVVAEPGGALAADYRRIARRVAARLSRQARNKQIAFPSIVVQDS
ncbi:MAG: iron-sulfur cluster carrier protein ApbC [Silanimonas lenta]